MQTSMSIAVLGFTDAVISDDVSGVTGFGALLD